jgi:NAD(P)-dependent dehydrogenase (short-subunit alcohol dehydrogenase family)
MDLGFVGKVVVVTGASKGIGYACAEAFAREGARVALVSRSDANLDAALARIPAGAHAPCKYMADLVRAEDAARMIDGVERTGSDRRARQLGWCGTPLRAGRPRRRRVACRDGCEVFQLHPPGSRGRCRAWLPADAEAS